MEEFLGEQGIKRHDALVALNPGAGRENKRWPVQHMRALAERLGAEPGVRLLLLWGPDEIHMARQIRDGLCDEGHPGAAHRSRRADRPAAAHGSLLIANDTGPLHLAAALGTPCLGLYGPTPARRNRPYGPHGRGLQSPTAPWPASSPPWSSTPRVALLAERGARRDAALGHHRRVERGGAPSRVPRERGAAPTRSW